MCPGFWRETPPDPSRSSNCFLVSSCGTNGSLSLSTKIERGRFARIFLKSIGVSTHGLAIASASGPSRLIKLNHPLAYFRHLGVRHVRHHHLHSFLFKSRLSPRHPISFRRPVPLMNNNR